MLPLSHKIAFLCFAVVTAGLSLRGFERIYRQLQSASPDVEDRTNNVWQRLRYAALTTLSQRRTFAKRPIVSLLHSFIFYGFLSYLLVNVTDAIEGYLPIAVSSAHTIGALYNLLADVFTALTLIGVLALVARRFASPARAHFRFNANTLLHESIKRGKINRDSLVVSSFILFHVGSRAVGAGAKLAAEGPDRFQPFASQFSQFFSPAHAEAWRIFGFWGALGSILAFLLYLPYSKHIHLVMAPANYLFARSEPSGVLPPLEMGLESSGSGEDLILGAATLQQLAWPRLLDAYACIQCNRCQDVCPAAATGKALSPAALEINKRMELNSLAASSASGGEAPPARPLLEFALSPEALWACTTCGACMQVCPVQNEQMLDIVDIRRHQVMMEGVFPSQLQSAFRGMERAGNPWGISHDQRMAWAEGLNVPTIAENPDADIIYWVGCAPSYDPQSQKTARALVQLLQQAGVNFAVLGKSECCTGDSARRAGNEYLYNQLATQNVETLQSISPRRIVTTCPHCMNAIGNEYRQLGGNFEVVHHTELLESLVAEGRLSPSKTERSITYHDPCYLGRHNGVYDSPRNLLRVLTNEMVELPRTREGAFCCGAGGAQFWKEEEPGPEKVTVNRFNEARETLSACSGTKTVAVGCPFCKSMLSSTPDQASSQIEIRDVAELLLEAVRPNVAPAVPLGDEVSISGD